MQNDESVLQYTHLEQLSQDTHVYELDDGALLFHHYSARQPLLYAAWSPRPAIGASPYHYAKREELPSDEISVLAPHCNALYFTAGRKIFKAFKDTVTDNLVVQYVKDIAKDATVNRGGLIVRRDIEVGMQISRLWDTEEVVVDVSMDALQGFVPVGVHRGRVLYTKHGCGGEPGATKISKKLIAIELPHNVRPNLLVRDHWNLIYIENDRTLFVLDTETMEFLPPLSIKWADGDCIPTAVKNGVLHAMCRLASWYYMRVPLPAQYVCAASSEQKQLECGHNRRQSSANTTDNNVLRFSLREALREDTNVYLLDNSTVFYYKDAARPRLYVDWEGDRIQAELPDEDVSNVTAHLNAIYFCVHRKIYKASFDSTQRKIDVVFVREISKDERAHRGGAISVRNPDQFSISTLWSSKSVHVDVASDILRGYALAGMHRNKVIFVRTGCGDEPEATILSTRVTAIRLPQNASVNLLARDALKFLYIAHARSLFTLDTETMQFLPALEIPSDVKVCLPIGIRDGELHAMCGSATSWNYKTAPLPAWALCSEETCKTKERLYFDLSTSGLQLGKVSLSIGDMRKGSTKSNNQMSLFRSAVKLLSEEQPIEGIASASGNPPQPSQTVTVPMSRLNPQSGRPYKMQPMQQQGYGGPGVQVRYPSSTPDYAQEAFAYTQQQQQQRPSPASLQHQPPAPPQQATPLSPISAREAELEQLNKELLEEIEKKNLRIKALEEQLIECKIDALQSVKRPLKFDEVEKLAKPLICIQVRDILLSEVPTSNVLYFDNAKPFELFMVVDGTRINADMKLLDGEYDVSYRGTIAMQPYITAIRGKVIKFFTAKVEEKSITLELINELKTSEISLFKNQPLYFIERSKEWSVYYYIKKYTEEEGERFDISEIDLLSKYERHYHKGVLYLFRESSTASLTRVNEKVVKVEGPLLDRDCTSYYTAAHLPCILIANSDENVLILLNTYDLTVSQLCYDAPADSTHHSIVGVHEETLTMAFDGVWGRHLATTHLPKSLQGL